MKRSLFNGMACAGLLLFSFGAGQALAQYHDDDTWHQTREGFFAGNSWRMHLFERVQDLSAARSPRRPYGRSCRVGFCFFRISIALDYFCAC